MLLRERLLGWEFDYTRHLKKQTTVLKFANLLTCCRTQLPVSWVISRALKWRWLLEVYIKWQFVVNVYSEEALSSGKGQIFYRLLRFRNRLEWLVLAVLYPRQASWALNKVAHFKSIRLGSLMPVWCTCIFRTLQTFWPIKAVEFWYILFNVFLWHLFKWYGCLIKPVLWWSEDSEGRDEKTQRGGWPVPGLASWLLMLLASFFLFSFLTFWLVTPGMTGRCAGGVWAIGELRLSNRNLRS